MNQGDTIKLNDINIKQIIYIYIYTHLNTLYYKKKHDCIDQATMCVSASCSTFILVVYVGY